MITGPGSTQDVLRHLEWLRQRGVSPGTIEARRRALTRVRAALPSLLDATAEDLAVWRGGLQLAPHTIRCYVSHVHQFYAWALDQGFLESNPAAGLPVPKRPRLLPRPIDEEALAAALVRAPPTIRPWLVLAGWAGLRAQEIARLRRENIMEQPPRPVLCVSSDAAKGSNERIVPLSAFVLGELAPLLPARGWVFRRADGKPGPNEPWTVSHYANRHLHDCGTAATLHQLRHRFATQAYHASGRDLRAVQELLGHRDPATTAGYAAYDQAAAAAAVEAIPAPLVAADHDRHPRPGAAHQGRDDDRAADYLPPGSLQHPDPLLVVGDRRSELFVDDAELGAHLDLPGVDVQERHRRRHHWLRWNGH